MNLTRRDFLATTTAASTLATLAASAQNTPPAAPPSGPKIKLGLIGAGGRGAWIANFFREHGGFEVHAVADYFADRVRSAGDKLGVDASRRFTGLSGYKKVLESGVEAVAIISPPYFHPEQAAAAVDAGKHVYLAKPVAVDVPGCLSVEASGKKAAEKNLAFIVDFQTRADPFYIEALRRVHAGTIGRMVFVEGIYHADCPFYGHFDAVSKHPDDPETKMRAWGLDKVLSGDIITEQNIHTIDVVNWVMREPPVSAAGTCGLTGRQKIGTVADHFTCHFQYGDGVGCTFSSKQFNGRDTKPDGIRVRAFADKGVLETEYGGNVMIRAEGDAFYRGGKSPGIYADGAKANIAAFHRNISAKHFANETVAPSVRSNLMTILGRTACYAGGLVTWEKMMAANERLEFDLKGLKS